MTRPLPKLRSIDQRRAVAQLRRHANRRVGRRTPPFGHREIPLHRHRLQEAVSLAGEHAEDEVPLDLQSGAGSRRSTSNSACASSGTGNSPLPFRYRKSLKNFTSQRSPRKNATPPPPATYFSNAVDRRRLQPLDVRQVDGPIIAQRLEAQVTRAFRSAAGCPCEPTRPAPTRCSDSGRRGHARRRRSAAPARRPASRSRSSGSCRPPPRRLPAAR